jgi:hypothetical protein
MSYEVWGDDDDFQGPDLPEGAWPEETAQEALALLKQLAVVKRHAPNKARPNYVNKYLTLNVPVELLSLLDQFLKENP